MSPLRRSQLRPTNNVPLAGAMTSKQTSGTTNVPCTSSPTTMGVGTGEDFATGIGPVDTNRTKPSQPEQPAASTSTQRNDPNRRIPPALHQGTWRQEG